MSEAAQESWMGRNWKWFVPVGCLGLLGLAAAALAGLFFLIIGVIKNSEVYELALSEARSNPELIAAIGEPMSDGFMPSGRISTSGSSGEADLSAHLTGPNGRARLYIVARRRANVWTFDYLRAELDENRGTIDLLAE
ncbi:MAG: cytochrome c oxidase assembly factor Coa1 family protein [Wenzhouxiangella sp.]|jgi:hypothetical protein|nr:cytochrome c oxidase assembly factor Coa1 family protein [Wenzhouxiangella sp.]